MRILLLTTGSHGDIHPSIAVGRALKERGATAVLMTNPWFEQEIRSAGLEFVASHGEATDVRTFMQNNPWMNNPRIAGKRLFRDMIVPGVPEMLERLDREIRRERPDAAMVHPLYFGAPGMLDGHQVPWASSSLAPSTWMSGSEAMCTMPVPPWGVQPPLWFWQFSRWVALPLLRRWIDPGVNAALAAHGIPPGRDHFLLCSRGGRLSLGMWSAAFRPRKEDDPARSVICGFPWYDSGELHRTSAELAAFIENGPPPIVFSLGTATVHAPGRFFETAAAVAKRLGRRAVLLTGRGSAAPPSLPEGVLATPYAPFGWLLPRAAATVHHGGIGTTAQSLRSGRPSVIVPHCHDQFDNAARAERLGVSRAVLRPTVDRLVRALGAVLDEGGGCSRRAAVLGERIASEDGAATAAEQLLGLAAGPGGGRGAPVAAA
jgi:rhamnosyltransferase subunit B